MAHKGTAGRMKGILALSLLFGPALFLIVIGVVGARRCEHKFKVPDDYGKVINYSFTDARGKKFTSEDFNVFHPGGKLGRKLLKVRDLMHTGAEMPIVDPNASMPDTILVMTQKTFGIAGVVDQGKLLGVVTDGDLRRHMQSNLLTKTAGDIMTKAPRTAQANILAAEALRLMNEWKVACLFVVEDSKPVGIVRLHDILRAGAV